MVDAVVDPDIDLLVRTVYGEGENEPSESQQAIAATALNRANTNFEGRGGSLRQQILSPGQFQAWQNPDLVKRMNALSPGDPAYQNILAGIQPLKSGQINLPYVHYLNRKTTPAGSTALTGFAAKPGVKLGSQEYYGPEITNDGYSDPDLANAMGSGNFKTVGSTGYSDPDLATAMGIGSDPDITDAETHKPTGSSAQQQTLRRYQATGDLSTDPKTNQPFFKGLPIYAPKTDEEIEKGVPTGAYYVQNDKTGTLRFKGPKTDDALGSIGQGIDDLVQNLGDVLPGGKNTDLHNRLQVLQDQYNATKSGTLVNDASRYAGQLIPTTMALGGAGGVGNLLAKSAPVAAPALEFLGGSAGKAALNAAGNKVGGNLLLRGASLAANGALQGGISNTLMSTEPNQSPLDKFRTGAEFGAIVNPAIAGAGSSIVNSVFPKTSGFVNSLTQDLDKFGLLKGPGAIRATQLQGTDANLPAGRIPVTAAEKAADQDQKLINNGAFGYRDNATAQPLRMMQAVGSTIGLKPEQMPNGFTDEAMSTAYTNTGNAISDVRSRQTLNGKDLKQLFTDMSQEAVKAKDSKANPADVEKLRSIINKVKDATRMTGKLTGDQWQALVSHGTDFYNLMANDDPTIARAAKNMRKIGEGAIGSGSTPEDAAKLKQAQLQYKTWHSIKDLVNQYPGGIFPMSKLQGAVNSNFDYSPLTTKSPIETLSDVGQRLPNLDTGPYKSSANKFGHTALGMAIGELGLYGLGSLNMGSAAGAAVAGGAAGLVAGRKVANTLEGAVANNPFLREQLLSNKGYNPNSLTQYFTNNYPVPATVGLTHMNAPKTVQQNNAFIQDTLQSKQQQGKK